jgi:hypothetical protein
MEQPETRRNSKTITILVLLCLLLAGYSVWDYMQPLPPPVYQAPKVVYKEKILRDTVRITVVTPPIVKTIYLPDTVRRARLEKGTLVTGVKRDAKRQMLEVETMDPKGVAIVSEYPIKKHEAFVISATGEVQVTPEKEQRRPARFLWFAFGFLVGMSAGASSAN